MKDLRNIYYDANFTAGGLLYHEFLALEKIVSGENIVDELKAEESLNQFVGINTVGARIRILREVKRRVKTTPKEFWDQFYQWNEKEKKLGLFYVCLATYKIVFDIHWEVAIVKYRTAGTFDPYAISMFLDELASNEEQVASWSPSTLEKIKTRYLRVLQNAGLLNENRLQKPQGITDSFWNFFKENNIKWFLEACFIA
jgi:hypothetical protein